MGNFDRVLFDKSFCLNLQKRIGLNYFLGKLFKDVFYEFLSFNH